MSDVRPARATIEWHLETFKDPQREFEFLAEALPLARSCATEKQGAIIDKYIIEIENMRGRDPGLDSFMQLMGRLDEKSADNTMPFLRDADCKQERKEWDKVLALLPQRDYRGDEVS